MTQQVGFSDIYLAAALMSYGVMYSDIDRTDPRRQKFIFEASPLSIVVSEDDIRVTTIRNPSLEEFEKRFVMGTLYFPPGYPESLKKIKTMVHSTYDTKR